MQSSNNSINLVTALTQIGSGYSLELYRGGVYEDGPEIGVARLPILFVARPFFPQYFSIKITTIYRPSYSGPSLYTPSPVA